MIATRRHHYGPVAAPPRRPWNARMDVAHKYDAANPRNIHPELRIVVTDRALDRCWAEVSLLYGEWPSDQELIRAVNPIATSGSVKRNRHHGRDVCAII